MSSIYRFLLDRERLSPAPPGLPSALADAYRAVVFLSAGAHYLSDLILSEPREDSAISHAAAWADLLRRGVLRLEKTLGPMEWAWAAHREGRPVVHCGVTYPSPLAAAGGAARRVIAAVDAAAQDVWPSFDYVWPSFVGDYWPGRWRDDGDGLIRNLKEALAYPGMVRRCFVGRLNGPGPSDPSPVLSEAVQDLAGAAARLGKAAEIPRLCLSAAGAETNPGGAGRKAAEILRSLREGTRQVCEQAGLLEKFVLDNPLGGKVSPARPFVPRPLQKKILDALKGKALKADALQNRVGGVDRKQLYRDGINPLKEMGFVMHCDGLGYYRPDAPPPEMATGRATNAPPESHCFATV